MYSFEECARDPQVILCIPSREISLGIPRHSYQGDFPRKSYEGVLGISFGDSLEFLGSPTRDP